MTITKIPPAELKVMKFIWSSDFTVASKDVIEAMENYIIESKLQH